MQNKRKPRTQASFDFDCAVIGGGPGGLVSALYLRRYRRRVVLIHSGIPRASWIPETRNLIGFPDGISGQALLARMRRQLAKLGCEKIPAKAVVKRLPKKGNEPAFQVEAGAETLKVRRVILATGIEDGQPALPNLNQLRRSGLLRYCPVCDAYDYCGCKVGVLAIDDHGIEKALFLRKFTPKIELVIPEEHILNSTRTLGLRKAGIHVHRGGLAAVEETKSGLVISLDSGKTVRVDVAYPAYGARLIETAFTSLKGLRRAKSGFIITTTEQRTSIPGLYAVGDCVNLLAQLSVAAGQGAVAATTINEELCEID